MEPDDLLCSRNARSRTPLVGRAQREINQAPSLKRRMTERSVFPNLAQRTSLNCIVQLT